jgi:transcriptional regulator with XRE-family HTH domain
MTVTEGLVRIDGRKLRRLRQESLLSVRELAERANISKTTLSELEREEHGAQMRTVRALADALGVDGRELLVFEEDEA